MMRQSTQNLRNMGDRSPPQIVAKEGVVPPLPWKLLKSKQHQGRMFFYNSDTRTSTWTLDQCFFNAEQQQQLFDGDNSLHKSNKEKKHGGNFDASPISKYTLSKVSRPSSQSPALPCVSPIPMNIFTTSTHPLDNFSVDTPLDGSSTTSSFIAPSSSVSDTPDCADRSIIKNLPLLLPLSDRDSRSHCVTHHHASQSRSSWDGIPSRRRGSVANLVDRRPSLPSTMMGEKILTSDVESNSDKRIPLRRRSIADIVRGHYYHSRSSSLSSGEDNPGNDAVDVPLSTSSEISFNLNPRQQHQQPKYHVVDALGMGGFSIVLEVQNLNDRGINSDHINNNLNLNDNISKNATSINNMNYQKNQQSWAMKKVYKSKCCSWQARLQQVQEIDLMRELSSSPYFLKCEHIFEDKYYLFFIFEKLCGDLFYHLFQQIKSSSSSSSSSSKHSIKSFSEKQCRIILAELAIAIEFMHSHDIIHRDLKIENVAIDMKGHVKIIDLGLAVHIESDIQPMRPIGSLAYMAPELVSKHIGGVFTDWWAYGVLAHELLTGRSPWSSLNNRQTLYHEIMNNEISLTPSLGLSKTACDFVCCLLNHDFRQRLGSLEPSSSLTNHDKMSQIQNKHLMIRKHAFFKSIKLWEQFEKQENIPAFDQKYLLEQKNCLSHEERKEILTKHDFDPISSNAVHHNESSLSSSLSSSSSSDEVSGNWMLGYPDASQILLPDNQYWNIND